MPRLIGFSTGFHHLMPIPYEERIRNFSVLGLTAIEIHLSDIIPEPELLSLDAVNRILQFPYRSLHLPNFHFPSPEAEKLLPLLGQFVTDLQPHTLVMHPDRIDEFGWVREHFPSHLALENMDWRKRDGQSVAQMERYFKELPHATWVCDINHVFTIDPSMALAKELHVAFADRLVHYHLSGFGDANKLHTLISSTHEDIMFGAIENPNIPIIIESTATEDEHDLETEYRYIIERLKQE